MSERKFLTSSIDGLARIVTLKFAAFLPFFLEGELLLSELNG